MQITYLKYHDIDKQKWDDCISNSFNGIFYGFSFYLDEVCESWDALIADDYKAVMPLPKKNKFGIQYSIQPLFCQQLGIFSQLHLDEILVWKFIKSIPKEFKYIHIHLNSQVHFTSGSNAIVSKKNYRLPLVNSYEDIQKNYNQNNKRNIKKAIQNEYVFIDQISLESNLDFYAKHTSDENMGENELNIFKRICFEMNRKGLCTSAAVYDENKNIAAMSIYFHGPNFIVYMAGSSTKEAKKTGAMAFIMDAIILKFSNSSLVLDFEGSEIEGIEQYFKSFGAVLVPYYIYKKNNLPLLLKWLKR